MSRRAQIRCRSLSSSEMERCGEKETWGSAPGADQGVGPRHARISDAARGSGPGFQPPLLLTPPCFASRSGLHAQPAFSGSESHSSCRVER